MFVFLAALLKFSPERALESPNNGGIDFQKAKRWWGRRRARTSTHHRRNCSFPFWTRCFRLSSHKSIFINFGWKIQVAVHSLTLYLISNCFITGKVFVFLTLRFRGLVLITFSRSPSFYLQLLKQKGIVVSSTSKW